MMCAPIVEVKHQTVCCWSGAYFMFTVEDVFWDSAILHATPVAEQSQAMLARHSIHAGSGCQFEHFCVEDVILPFDAKDVSETI